MVMSVDELNETLMDIYPTNEDNTERQHFVEDRHCRSFVSEQGRDASCTHRDFHMEDSRQSLSHTSILNVTSDDEEDDAMVEPRSFLFDDDDGDRSISPVDESLVVPTDGGSDANLSDLRQSRESGHSATKNIVEPMSDSTNPDLDESWLDSSIQQVTDSFVETLCPSSSSGDDSCGASLQKVCDDMVKWGAHMRRQIELDLLSVLGCQTDPTDDELDAWVSPLFLWTPESYTAESPVRGSTTARVSLATPTRPYNRSIKDRADRIRHWRVSVHQEGSSNQPFPVGTSKSMDDRFLPMPCTQISPPPTLTTTLTKSFLVSDDPLGLFIGKGMEPIEPEHNEECPEKLDLGYDSDPEDYVLNSMVKSASEARTVTPTQDDDEQHGEHDYMPLDVHRLRVAEESKDAMMLVPDNVLGILPSVQETLNTTWTLTWHPSTAQQPVLSDVWIERGSLLNYGSTVVEPKFMWRHVYQPHLQQNRKLHETSEKPIEVRVLNACRIVEAQSIDRNKYPMARTSCSFYLRTCHDEEYLFEATSPEERARIIKGWKVVVARLASLAVLEEMDTMALEFFTPVVTSQMLLTTSHHRVAMF